MKSPFRLFGPAIFLMAALLAAFSATPSFAAGPGPAWVELGADGAPIVRTAVGDGQPCPSLSVRLRLRSRHHLPMSLRAPSASGASFDISVCEARLPRSARQVWLAGVRLPLPPRTMRRLVVIGDTGCRLKASANGGVFQACNDPNDYPFAQVAKAAAAWKPDLVIHVGDYLYRESPCPAGNTGCAGSPSGDRWASWRADFFDPAAPLLRTAALVAARGNHEDCARAGSGYRRLLDIAALSPSTDCHDPANRLDGDTSAPFAVPLGHDTQLVVFDSAAAGNKPLAADDPLMVRLQATYAAITSLSAKAGHTILVDHHPWLAYAAGTSKSGQPTLYGGNAALISAFASKSPALAPPSADMILSGHVHVFEAVSFKTDLPVQIVAGFSGTDEDKVPLPTSPPTDLDPAPGAKVDQLASWIDGFGFLTLTRTGAAHWRMEVRDRFGKPLQTCQIIGRRLACTPDRIAAHSD